MSSLLGPFHFSKDRQAYFHVRIHIHELNNVPLLEGSFKAKWKIEHTYHLANAAQASHGIAHAVVSTSRDGAAAGNTSASRMLDTLALRRHRSNSTLASQTTNRSPTEKDAPRGTGGHGPKARHVSIESGTEANSLRDPLADSEAGSEDAHSVHRSSSVSSSNANKPSFISHFKGMLHPHGSSGSSRAASPMPDPTTPHKSQSSGQESPTSDRDGISRRKSLSSPPKSGTESTEDVTTGQATSLASTSSVNARDYGTSRDSLRHIKRPSTGESSMRSHSSNHSSTDHKGSEGIRRASSTKSESQSHPWLGSNSENQHHHNHSHTHHHHQTTTRLPEPRGETDSRRVKEHRVHWEREIEVGVRIPIEKQRPSSKPSTPVSGDGSMKRQGSRRDLQADAGEGSVRSDASFRDNGISPGGVRFGTLGQSELRIVVRAEIPTEKHHSSGHGSRATEINMGYASINLAEFAPHSSHRHGDSVHHHHHHHHHRTAHTRTETRRYLLHEGPTNAMLKLTVEMVHIGGSLEYSVPRNKCGMLMTSAVSPEVEQIQQHGTEATSSGLASSSSSTSEKGGAGSAESGSGSPTNRRHHNVRPGSTTMASASTISHLSGISRNQRIPAENLTTELTHHDAARAVKEVSGADRLALSFSAAAHHDRAPEEIIDLLFDPKMTAESLSRLVASSASSSSARRQSKSSAESKSSRGGPVLSQGSTSDFHFSSAKSSRTSASTNSSQSASKSKPNSQDSTVKQTETFPPHSGRKSTPPISRATTVRWDDQVDAPKWNEHAPSSRENQGPGPRFLTPNASSSSLRQTSSSGFPIATSPQPMSPVPTRDMEQSVESDVDVGKPLSSSTTSIQV